jgi:hypothetical protein
MIPLHNPGNKRTGQLSIGDFTKELPANSIKFDSENPQQHTPKQNSNTDENSGGDWHTPIQCKSIESGRTVAMEIVKIIQSSYHYFGGWNNAFETILDIIFYALTRKEEQYMNTIKPLDKRAVECAVQVYSRLFKALYYDFCIHDILGDVYMEIASISRSKHFGQFFTPMHICEMMAKMQLGNIEQLIQEANTKQRKITVCDPCVGSGAMHLGCKRVILQECGLQGLDAFAFYGMDIDKVCVNMCKIQMILTNYRYMADLLLTTAMDIRKAGNMKVTYS